MQNCSNTKMILYNIETNSLTNRTNKNTTFWIQNKNYETNRTIENFFLAFEILSLYYIDLQANQPNDEEYVGTVTVFEIILYLRYSMYQMTFFYKNPIFPWADSWIHAQI